MAEYNYEMGAKMAQLHEEHGIPEWHLDDNPLTNGDRFYLSGYAHGFFDDPWRPEPVVVDEKMRELWHQGFEDGKGDREKR